MKTRTGFVSNSSSTSFCIIGVDDLDLVAELLAAEELNWKEDMEWGGSLEGNLLSFYGCLGQAEYAGIDAENILAKQGIAQAKKQFASLVKRQLKVDVPIGAVRLLYGESTSEA
ncbi:MAG: hypothetical protein ABFE07_28775 [Armatimonadia bacterium]